jgi:hypothetical protein
MVARVLIRDIVVSSTVCRFSESCASRAKAQLNEVAISSDFFILTRDAEVILEAASGG